MGEINFPAHTIELVGSLYQDQESTVKMGNGDTEWFTIVQRVRQGCILSPRFNINAQCIMRKAFDGFDGQVKWQVSDVGRCRITNNVSNIIMPTTQH